MNRASLLSSICALGLVIACKSEQASAPESAPMSAPPSEAVRADDEAPGAAPSTEPTVEEEARSAEDSKPADSADATAAGNAGPADRAMAPGTPKPSLDDKDAVGDETTPLPGTGVPEPIVQGNLDRDIIRRVVRSKASDVRDCYNTGLRSNPALRGTVTIEFTIDAKGKVEDAKAGDGGDFEDPKVARCIADAIADWEFPSGRGQTTVSYPFTLDPG